MHSILISALIALQSFVVVFIALHDWIPLGSLNNVRAVQAADPRAKLLAVTAVSTLPFAVGLGATIAYADTRLPGWLNIYLWICYGAAVYGLVRAWWGPYFSTARPRGRPDTRPCSAARTPFFRSAMASVPTPCTSPCTSLSSPSSPCWRC